MKLNPPRGNDIMGLPMSNPMTITVNKVQNTMQVQLGGRVDETAIFPKIEDGDISSVVIDLDGIESISSAGVRRWVSWIWNLEKQFPSATITLTRCQVPMVHQITTFRKFLPAKSVIDSLYIPYYCDACGADASILFDRVTLEKDGIYLPELLQNKVVDCPTCSKPMNLDVDPVTCASLFAEKSS